MTDKKELVSIYKKKCRAYFSYDAELKKAKEDLQLIIAQIENVRSPITDRVGGHQSAFEEKLVPLIAQKTEIELEVSYYQGNIDWIMMGLNKITSPAYRAITWQTLVQARSRYDLMVNYDVDPEYVFDIRDKFLLKAMDEEMLTKYEELLKIKDSSSWLKLKDKVD